jgi:hypothetical protein
MEGQALLGHGKAGESEDEDDCSIGFNGIPRPSRHTQRSDVTA